MANLDIFDNLLHMIIEISSWLIWIQEVISIILI